LLKSQRIANNVSITAQIMYMHVRKCKNDDIKLKKKNSKMKQKLNRWPKKNLIGIKFLKSLKKTIKISY
jgi:hypothetical protein